MPGFWCRDGEVERGRAAVRCAFVPLFADERAPVGQLQRADHVAEGRVSCARGGREGK